MRDEYDTKILQSDSALGKELQRGQLTEIKSKINLINSPIMTQFTEATGMGEHRNVPLPKSEKFLWKTGVILLGYIHALEKKQKTHQIFGQKLQKSQFSIKIFSKI